MNIKGNQISFLFLPPRLSRLEAPTNATGTPHSSASATSNKSTPVKKVPSLNLYHCFVSKYIHDQAALVSYHDPDAGLSDEERSPVPMDLESDAEAEGEGEGNGEDAEAEVEYYYSFWKHQMSKCF